MGCNQKKLKLFTETYRIILKLLVIYSQNQIVIFLQKTP